MQELKTEATPLLKQQKHPLLLTDIELFKVIEDYRKGELKITLEAALLAQLMLQNRGH